MPIRLTALTAGALLCLGSCSPQPARPRDRIAIAVPFDLASLDPHAEDKLGSAAILSNLYEGLVTIDAEMKIQPCLATSWESPDPRSWIFHLRSGVTFHSGRPLQAADVVFSYERLLQSTDLEIRAYLLNVSDVRALDPLTVWVRTVRPSRILLNKLSHVPIVPDGASPQALAAAADGTGPYVLELWKKGQSILLRRNARYWGRKPDLLQVELALARAPDVALRGLLAGRYQLVKGDSKAIEAAAARSDRWRILRRDNLFVKYIGFDLVRDVTPFCKARPNPFKDLRVRRAMDLALDRSRLVAGLGNQGVPAPQPVPRFVFGFNPEIARPSHDVERARELLKAAGLGQGFDAVLHARPVVAEAAARVRDDLATVGIRLKVALLPDSEFFALMSAGKGTLWLNSYGCSSGDASDLFDAVVHSPGRERGFGMRNFGRFADPTLDEAIERSAGIEKPEERRNALQQIMASVMDRLLVIPLYNDQDAYALEAALGWSPRSDSYVRAADIEVR